MEEVKVGKLAVVDGPFTVGVWVGKEPCAKFIKLDDADLFAAHKRTELKAMESQKLVEQGLCAMCGKSMDGLPFKYHERCPQ